MPRRTGLDLDSGERLHYRGDLRFDGEVAVTDERLLVRRADELVSVPYANVSEVTTEQVDWFLVLMSLALAGFGVYSLSTNPLLGAGAVAFGGWSVYRTYRHRDRVRVHTHSRPKPVEVFPADVDALYAELEPAIEAVRADAEREAAGDDAERETAG